MSVYSHMPQNLQILTDEKLFNLCQEYGQRARLWRQKFVGLLPEVNRRRLYEKKGFGSIFEFAAKIAGLSEEHVRRVLNLEKKFENRQILKKILENGAVSVNKLVRIASVATPENQEFWAGQAEVLPNRALETLIRDERVVSRQEFVHVHTNSSQNFKKSNTEENPENSLNFSPEVYKKLLTLQNKGIDINALLQEFFEERELKIAQEKEKIASSIKKTESRYLPVRVREILKKEHGTKCAIDLCKKEAKSIHHSARFALSKSHNPLYLAPLCREHHVIAHNIDRKFKEHTLWR